MSNFIKIHVAATELFCANRQTDKQRHDEANNSFQKICKRAHKRVM